MQLDTLGVSLQLYRMNANGKDEEKEERKGEGNPQCDVEKREGGDI